MVAADGQTVTVTGEVPRINTRRSAIGSTFSSSSSRGTRGSRSKSGPQPSYSPPAPIDWVAPPTRDFNTEAYDLITDNPFKSVLDHPLSTFSIDVDRASYANVRRFLSSYQLPPKDAVRIEELVNYFDYDYPDPEGDAPFSVSFEQMECPWKRDHRLVRIGLEGREIEVDARPPSNLVFLLDVKTPRAATMDVSQRMSVDAPGPGQVVSNGRAAISPEEYLRLLGATTLNAKVLGLDVEFRREQLRAMRDFGERLHIRPRGKTNSRY